MQKGVNSRYRSALKKDAVCLIKRDTAAAVKTNAVVRQKLTLLSVGRPPHRPQPRRRQIRYSVVIFLANVALSGPELPKKMHSNTGTGDYFPKKVILRAYVWVVRPPILVNESLLTNTERAPGNRVAKYRARPQAARRYAA